MTLPDSDKWTRRKLLTTAPAVFAPAFLPAGIGAILADATLKSNVSQPFSKFVDIARSAGLTETMFYGEATNVKYIIESVGGGCAFFDYDNDGWMDIFIVGGRTLAAIPPGASNRLYHNNRDGTFKDVTDKAGLTKAGWGKRCLHRRL